MPSKGTFLSTVLRSFNWKSPSRFMASNVHAPKIQGFKDKFVDLYKKLKEELVADTETFRYTKEAREWVSEMLDYTVPGGKLNRGLSVVDSLALLKPETELSEEEINEAIVLGWCIEWLQAYFLILDDIMDNSLTRRGQKCWYRNEKVGNIAINDGILLRNHIPRMLKCHFRSKPYYTDLRDLFDEVEFQTACGQLLDLITTPAGEVDLSKYVMDTYLRIVKYKTAYYSFYLPVACALYLKGETSEAKFEVAERILVQMGTYFQIQDDYLDCYGDPEVIGKIGTDIQDTKCSWLIVQALKRATPEQRQILRENYGKHDDHCVQEVKAVYKELKLQDAFLQYEKESYDELIVEIEKEESLELQQVLKSFFSKIYKRQK